VTYRNQIKQWQSAYETLEEFVVPRSSNYLGITDKDGNQLWTVTLFEKSVDSFITKARNQLKVYVRRVDYNVKAYEEEKKKKEELNEKIKIVEADLKKNCEIVYSALFECLMHLKILRAHIECVLRWGLPPKYFLCVIKMGSGKEKKTIQNLIKVFAGEDAEKGMYGTKEEIGESEDYFPFILTPMGVTIYE